MLPAVQNPQGIATAGPAGDDRQQLNAGAVVEFPVVLPATAVRHRARRGAGVGAPIALEGHGIGRVRERQAARHANQGCGQTQ